MENIKVMLKRAWDYGKSLYVIVFFENMLSAALSMIHIVGIGIVVKALLQRREKHFIFQMILVYVSIYFFSSVMQVFLDWRHNVVARKVSNMIVSGLMKDALYVDYHYVQANQLLNLRWRVSNLDPAQIITLCGKFIQHIVQITGVIYIFARFSPWFIAVLGVTSTLTILLSFKKHDNEFKLSSSKSEEDRKMDYIYRVMSSYEYAKEVRMNQGQEYFLAKYSDSLKKQINYMKCFLNKAIVLNTLSTVITMLQSLSMYLYFTYLVSYKYIDIAEYIVLLSATTLFTTVLIAFFDNIAAIKEKSRSVDYLKQYDSIIQEHSRCKVDSSKLPLDSPVVNISFEHVSFKYPDSTNEVLHDINIQIKHGEKIGIVGINGSGKTTFVKLLTRIYEPTQGKIYMNGIDIKKIPYDTYNKMIGVVLQDYFLFAYSIKENIAFNQSYSEDNMKKSILLSGLKGKLDSLEKGFDTSVYKDLDDEGIELSGGEGQKLALARVIYKNTEVLVFDEPTSTMDPFSEYEMFMNMSEISRGKTAIFISHRLSSTRFCDRILVFDNGSIIEEGSHDELMQTKGEYSQLFEAQADYYRERSEVG